MNDLVQKIDSAKILGVLECIQKVNYMISVQQLNGQESMVSQYERQRDDFLKQLSQLLSNLQIKATLKAKAA
ncbi:MAG: hypothetical protein MUC59_03795 [Saprospiraceae bacterium]|jgi:hypothetical protein|nr:hypothetical protein [Saprospiraceae bacterium]